MDPAATENDFARGEAFALVGDDRVHTGDMTPLEHETGRGATGDDGKIAAPAHRSIEVADRRRTALVRPVAHGHRAVAVAEVRIHIGDERDLPLLRIRVNRLGQRRPVLRLGAADRHRPVGPVQLAGKIYLVLELAEIGEHVAPAPAGRAQGFPFRIIVGRAAMRDHPHHRGAAAHDAALQERNRRRVVFAPPVHLQAGPEIRIVVV